MNLLKIASVPPPTASPEASVLEAVNLMHDQRVGAVAVTVNRILAGIFTERDLMIRVVLAGNNPKTTKLHEVMTAECICAKEEMSLGEALHIMTEKNFRHLPLVNNNNEVLGLLSIRNLLHQRVDTLSDELESLVSFFTADGIGG